MDDNRYFKKLKEIISNAYIPYSNFGVSCLLWTDKGWFSGVNVENAAYSPTLCAERNAVGAMITSGAKEIKQILILTQTLNGFGTPCGVCRQVLSEFASEDAIVITYNMSGKKTTYKLSELLPFSFGKKNLSFNKNN